jgi:hypothetical protein
LEHTEKHLLSLSFTGFDPDRSLTTSIRGTDVTECLRRSLRLDVRELDHLGPLLGFVGDQAAEIGG